MRLGVLDIGSNSAQLQIVDVAAGAPPLPALAVKTPTLLGEEIGADGCISPEGIKRVVDAVVRSMRVAVEQQVDQLYPFVTSAVRDALNRDEVIGQVEAAAGVRPQFLSGEQEARLTYLAAHRWYGWSAGRLLLIDIGGGSMEIVLGRDAEPNLAVSLPVGVGRMTRQFLPAHPNRPRQLKALRRHVAENLAEVADRLRWEAGPSLVVVTSKTFKQLTRLAGGAPQRKGPFVTRRLTRSQIRSWIPRLAALTPEERARLRGVSASRAHQILAGAVIANTTLKALNVEQVDLCPWALREGIILRHLEQITNDTELPLQPVIPGRAREATVTALRT
ncbi:Ppx/GppA family phosphatase [Kribbella sp. NPDC006257]|uniref:Ppx/GppA phosphatase family protein n=1 Tax=Kribbella sp. NPDC006257 TaxID=3156738 RepID=UPI0033B96B00